MNLRDTVWPRGSVNLEIWRSGRLARVEAPNLITTAGRERFPRVWGGDPDAKLPALIGLGDGGAVTSPDDTAISNPVFLPFSAPPVFGGPGVTFTSTADETQANGLWVREFGLFDADHILLARWVRPGGDLQKADDMRLIIRWGIEF